MDLRGFDEVTAFQPILATKYPEGTMAKEQDL
jgi:hypothetical protein